MVAHTAFDPVTALDALLAEVGLSTADAGGTVGFAGEDPIVPARSHDVRCCARRLVSPMPRAGPA